MNSKVSIIMPLYNCQDFLGEALASIQAQTYKEWEAILVDDCSEDSSYEIALKFAELDSRFIILKQSQNMGAAKARNRALDVSTGRYVAYLDSDDYWLPEKLTKQLAFMSSNEIGACFTSYETVNEDGSHRNYIHVDREVSYSHFLKKPPTCSHTIMFDTEVVERDTLSMPNIRKRQDAATWMQVIRANGPLYGLDEILAANRKRSGSLSANKVDAVRNTWRLYTEVEHLKRPYAAYCLAWQVFHATIKRLGRI